MLVLISIKLDKNAGEYTIKQRNEKGETIIATANHLTARERAFCLCRDPFVSRWCIIWA